MKKIVKYGRNVYFQENRKLVHLNQACDRLYIDSNHVQFAQKGEVADQFIDEYLSSKSMRSKSLTVNMCRFYKCMTLIDDDCSVSRLNCTMRRSSVFCDPVLSRKQFCRTTISSFHCHNLSYLRQAFVRRVI